MALQLPAPEKQLQYPSLVKECKTNRRKTTGLVSANNSIKISEDLYYLLSSSYEADRNNKEYKESILPDAEITGGDNFKDLLKDKKILSAIQWISNNKKPFGNKILKGFFFKFRIFAPEKFCQANT